jgi:hypothetical protein
MSFNIEIVHPVSLSNKMTCVEGAPEEDLRTLALLTPLRVCRTAGDSEPDGEHRGPKPFAWLNGSSRARTALNAVQHKIPTLSRNDPGVLAPEASR